MKPRRLIVNADDFGLNKGVTDGIVRAHLEGVVTSTSLMANMPGREYATSLRSSVPGLSIGVHLTLTQGRPVLPPEQLSSLVDSKGYFYSYPEAIRRFKHRRASSKEIEAEFRAQICWLKEHGIAPSHADSHHHIHLYPCSIGAYRAAIVKEGIPYSRAPRHWSYPAVGIIGGPHGGGTIRRLAVSAYMEYLQRITLRRMILPKSCVTAHPRFQHKWTNIAEGWSQILNNLPPGDFELGCHPGLLDNSASQPDEIADRRALELLVLTSQEIKDIIANREIQLIRFPDLNGHSNPKYAYNTPA